VRTGYPATRDESEAASLARRVDAICDRFEKDFQCNDGVDMRTYLVAVDASERPRLFYELLLVDRELRSARNSTLSWEEYRTTFAEFADQIEAARFIVESSKQESIGVPSESGSARWIAHFELLECIGVGGAAEVWKARDTRLQRLVAMKLPRAPLQSEREFNRFLREGRVAAQLNHPGIVPVYEVGRDGSTAFIVSKYFAGEDLRARLRRSRLSPRHSAELCRAVADALEHAHQHDVIHRDLKPSNVVIDDAGAPHITDFGLAKWPDGCRQSTLEGELLGTPAYMAPEQALGQSCYADRRTDVYSLGVVLYELLTGRCPFEGSLVSVPHQVIHQEPAAPRTLDRTIPRDLETICLRAMEKDPRRRYQTAHEFASDLSRYLDGQTILARPPARATKLLRWLGKHRIHVAAMVLAAAAIGAIVFALRTAREKDALLRLQPVVLSTTPPGAMVAFVPIDDATGEPLPDQIVRAPGLSPVRLELPPREYCVVAVLPADVTRFHEVLRRVPGPDDKLPGIFKHNHWAVERDGAFRLPAIEIPPASVANGMALIPGADSASISSNSHSARPTVSFYMDVHEVTEGEYHRLYGAYPADLRWRSNGPRHPVSVSFDYALAAAETLGKRLPTEREYDYAVTLTSTASEELSSSKDRTSAELVPVDAIHLDSTNTSPAVLGLLKNAVEWVEARDSNPSESNSRPRYRFPSDYRVVRGNYVSILGVAMLPFAHASTYESRCILSRHTFANGVGFRCVRSLRPRYFDHAQAIHQE
jgi:eukaryotic-like serine/threonine-protein kinase